MIKKNVFAIALVVLAALVAGAVGAGEVEGNGAGNAATPPCSAASPGEVGRACLAFPEQVALRPIASSDPSLGRGGALTLEMAAYAPEMRFERTSRWSRSAFWLGGAADLYTTKRALETPEFEEFNPFLAHGQSETTVLVSAAVFKAGAYLLLNRLHRRGSISRGHAEMFLVGFGAAQAGAAIHNWNELAER